MSFFYKYVDLSTYNQTNDTISESSSDETRALIMSQSHEKQQPDSYTGTAEDKGNESEFW